MQRRSALGYRPQMFTAFAMVALLFVALLPARASAQDYEPDLDSFVAEAYGFSIEWDRNVWNSTSSISFGDQESITISNGVTTVALTAGPEAGQTVGECIDTAVADIESAPEFLDPKSVNDLEVPGPRDGETGVTLTYGEMLEGRPSPVEMGAYLTCTQIDPDGMLLIQVDTRLGVWGEELEIVEALLDTLDTGL